MEETKSIDQKVEEHLRGKQANKEFRDSENRIGGAKKQMAAYKTIAMSDLSEIEEDEITAEGLVRKEKVYPEISIPEEQDKGVSAGAAFLKVKMRGSFGSSPPNNKDKRKVYVGFAEYLVKK